MTFDLDSTLVRAARGLSVAALLWSAPASAQNVAIEQLTLGSATTTIVIKGLAIEGSSISAEAVRGLSSAGDLKTAADIIGKLDAKSLKAASVETTDRVAKERNTTVLEGVELLDLKNGRAAKGSVAKGRFANTDDGETTATGAFGRMTLRDADIAFGLALQAPGPATARDLRNIYAGVEVGALEIDLREGGSMTIDRVVIQDVKARQMPRGLAATTEDFGAAENFESLDPKRRAALVRDLDLFFESFSVGSVEAAGLRFRNGGDDAVVGRILYTGAAAGKGAALAIENVTQADGEQKSRFGSIRFSDWSLTPLLKGLVAAYGDPAKVVEPSLASLLPAFGGMQIKDVSVSGVGGATTAPVSLAGFELRIDNRDGGIPKGLRIAVDGLAATVDPTDPDMAPLRDMGIKELDVSSGMELLLAGEDLQIKEISLRSAALGNLTLSGVIGNAGAIFAASSGESALMSAFGLSLKRLDVLVEDRGLAQRLAEQQAKASGKTPDQVRRETAGMAAVLLPATLGSSPGAKAVTAAVLKFVAKPGRLSVSAKAKNPAGIGAADAAVIAQPTEIFTLVDVEAKAE